MKLDVEEKILTEIGLSPTEAQVYLACLELGSDTVLKIAKKAGIKRPTCYLVLDDLIMKGYITKIQRKNTTEYAAEKPSIILNKYKEKIDNFKDLLPFYEAKFNSGKKPKIKFYEGKEEVGNVYTNILFPTPTTEIYFYGTDINKLLQTWPNLFSDYMNNRYKNFKTTMEIVSNDATSISYAKKYSKDRSIRVMPADLPVFSDSVITDDKLFIVSLDNLFGVLIESKDLAQTYKNFFY